MSKRKEVNHSQDIRKWSGNESSAAWGENTSLVLWSVKFMEVILTLKQEEENRRNADMLYEKVREQLRRKEDQ